MPVKNYGKLTKVFAANLARLRRGDTTWPSLADEVIAVQVEEGKISPTIQQADAIARALGTTLEEMLK